MLTFNPHFDFLWNLSNHLFGYKATRVYNAVPYVHVGAYGSDKFKHDINAAGGLGLLNRFRLNDCLVLNLDLRWMVSSAEALGRMNATSVANTLGAYIGVSYKFKQRNWTRASRKNLLSADMISNENGAYRQQVSQMESELADARRAQADAEARAKAAEEKATATANQATGDVTSVGLANLSNPEPLKVYFRIGEKTLSVTEQQHLRSYLQIIKAVGGKNAVKVVVTGRADTATGYKAWNERLAAARAEAIKAALVQNGISEGNITIKTELVNSGVADLDRCSEIKFE